MKVGCRLGKHFVGSAKHGGILLEEAVLHSLTKYIQGKELDASVHQYLLSTSLHARCYWKLVINVHKKTGLQHLFLKSP